MGTGWGEPGAATLDGNKHEHCGDPASSRIQAALGPAGEVAGDSPSKVSTESCRPRLCRGLTTQWLLVAVMSNTSQPSSEAQRVRLSSRNRSESLQERRRRRLWVSRSWLSHPVIQRDTDGDKDHAG